MENGKSGSKKPRIGIILMAHGAPASLADIPVYLKNIRGGKEPTDEMIKTISDRYAAIGGKSPMEEITRRQAEALEKFINRGSGDFKVYYGMRNWAPHIREAVQAAAQDGVERIVGICLAPQYSRWSTERYLDVFNTALKECGSKAETQFISSWPDEPCLVEAFAEAYTAAIARIKASGQHQIYTIFTAHSIPADSVEYGDPYPEEYARTVRAIVNRVRPFWWQKAYQSQGFIPIPWLGPTVESVIDNVSRYGRKAVLLVPVGFVSDHIEIIYDIDIGFKQYAAAKNLELWRTESLNTSPLFIEALASVVWQHLC